MMQPVLELPELTGGYGDTEIFHGVSMHVNAGEIVVIIGPMVQANQQ